MWAKPRGVWVQNHFSRPPPLPPTPSAEEPVTGIETATVLDGGKHWVCTLSVLVFFFVVIPSFFEFEYNVSSFFESEMGLLSA